MRALVYHGPNDIGVEERGDPEPGPGEVLLRITATGICGSDLHGYTGENKRRHPGQIMGHETVGRIVAVGSDVSGQGLEPGRVATVNPVIGCGECAQCAAGTEQLCPRRKVIGVNQGDRFGLRRAHARPGPQRRGVAGGHARGVRRTRRAAVRGLPRGDGRARRPDDAVLVIGGGPIGQACALAARRLGAEQVVVSEPSTARRQLVEKLGFATVDPITGDLAEQVQAALGRPATAVLDAVGPAGRSATACAPRRSEPASCWSGWAPAS